MSQYDVVRSGEFACTKSLVECTKNWHTPYLYIYIWILLKILINED
jgi:hypothetical protein